MAWWKWPGAGLKKEPALDVPKGVGQVPKGQTPCRAELGSEWSLQTAERGRAPVPTGQMPQGEIQGRTGFQTLASRVWPQEMWL